MYSACSILFSIAVLWSSDRVLSHVQALPATATCFISPPFYHPPCLVHGWEGWLMCSMQKLLHSQQMQEIKRLHLRRQHLQSRWCADWTSDSSKAGCTSEVAYRISMANQGIWSTRGTRGLSDSIRHEWWHHDRRRACSTSSQSSSCTCWTSMDSRSHGRGRKEQQGIHAEHGRLEEANREGQLQV